MPLLEEEVEDLPARIARDPEFDNFGLRQTEAVTIQLLSTGRHRLKIVDKFVSSIVRPHRALSRFGVPASSSIDLGQLTVNPASG